ncbi:methyltransferase domain-containing protein [Phytomonospora endophytica]|uniref:Ubiquinone/menaquinone biosynthesis C-methylase UbiE n=1 Tax=Phytomonospora endophytica TaxID=714109 RepID=A0A841FSP6_9ACTN|nr:methyltransferase domain-containing protein [Phytomonospora endophytica]MBB6035549.1 ubiquinone/menaquinone biosynthesis C-methylase UbiE [Phytomonospora endophytica]
MSTETLIHLLDRAETLPGAAELRTRTYELLRLRSGARVVDIGCGGGRAVAELGARWADVVGIDADPRMVAAARARHHTADIRQGDATALPFADGELDGYRADKVFHELPDPAVAVTEAHRVLTPGGRVVLAGQDWHALAIDSDHPGLTTRVVHARANAIIAPRAARAFRNLLLTAGFTEVAVEVHTGIFTDTAMLPMLTGLASTALRTLAISPGEHATWLAEQTARAEADRMLLAVPIFVASATKRA